eukprot:1461934-Amphidinium_carterae.1
MSDDGTREETLAAVSRDGLKLQFATEQQRGDVEIVLAAVSQHAEALQYASEELKCLKLRVRTRGSQLQKCFTSMLDPLISQNGYSLVYANPQLWGEKEIVLAAVKQAEDSVVHGMLLSTSNQTRRST